MNTPSFYEHEDGYLYFGGKPTGWARFIKKPKLTLWCTKETPYLDHRINDWQRHQLEQMFPCGPMLVPVEFVVEFMNVDGNWTDLTTTHAKRIL